MGNGGSSEEGSGGLASPSILSKVSVKGDKADMDAFLTEGRVDNVQISYVTRKQVRYMYSPPVSPFAWPRAFWTDRHDEWVEKAQQQRCVRATANTAVALFGVRQQ